MGKVLSERRKAILECIEEFIRDHGYPPTVREIGEKVNLHSPSTVHAHLRRLVEAGHIERAVNRTRAIRPKPIEGEFRVTNIPLVGSVAAGQPRLAEQEIQGMFGVPSELVPDGEGFLLEVRGDSMIGAGITEGDFVVVRRGEGRDGDIVVAMIEGEATVKRLRVKPGMIVLQPENDAYGPILSPNPTILGKVVGLFRRLA